MKLQYRRATIKDHEALRAAVLQSYGTYEQVLAPEHWATMKRNLEDAETSVRLLQSATAFICEEGETVAGLVYLVPSGEATPFFSADWAHIRQLGVLPEYRSLGIARALMECCIAHAREAGERTLALHTSAYQSAWRMYERLGFKKQRNLGTIYDHEYWLYTITL